MDGQEIEVKRIGVNVLCEEFSEQPVRTPGKNTSLILMNATKARIYPQYSIK